MNVQSQNFSADNNNLYNISTMRITEDFQLEKCEHGKNPTGSNDQVLLRQISCNEMEIDGQAEEDVISELVEATGNKDLMEGNQHRGMRIAFGVILRLVLPLANGVARGFKSIQIVRFLRVLRQIGSSRQALTDLIAFAANSLSMNLSSVQVSHRIDPLLKLLRIRKAQNGLESLPDISNIDNCDTPTIPNSPTMTFSPLLKEPNLSLHGFTLQNQNSTVPEALAAKCCTLNILAEPPPGTPIRADIILIHGLHGSLQNTWKQGLWEKERKPIGFERPPKPPVRPLKRSRHCRLTSMHPQHQQKRARIYSECSKESLNDDMSLDQTQNLFETEVEYNNSQYSYVCGPPRDIQRYEGFEYSFPAMRLRINNDGALIQKEIESILNEEDPMALGNKTDINRMDNKTNSTRSSMNDPDYSKCWPGDWLPLDCPGVRVIAVNYTTDPYLWRPLWKKKETRSNMIQRAREMADLLIEQRVGHGHPIIWVAHSKGGLFVKQIIVDAWESGRPAMTPFWHSTRGAFFFSVPHRGSHLASIKAPLLRRSVELIEIEKGSKYLLDLHRRFVSLYHLGHLKMEVFSFIEMALTLMSVLYLRIVGVDSADPGIGEVCGIRLDHREICKPRSRECILYKELVKMINKVS